MRDDDDVHDVTGPSSTELRPRKADTDAESGPTGFPVCPTWQNGCLRTRFSVTLGIRYRM